MRVLEIPSSGVRSGGGGHNRPVILGDTAPENPNHDNGEKREQCFEQSTVDFAVGCLAEMGADDKVEDLSNGEQKTSSAEIDCGLTTIILAGHFIIKK